MPKRDTPAGVKLKLIMKIQEKGVNGEEP